MVRREVTIETWKPCPDYEDIYEVSDLGRVRRVAAAQGTAPGYVLKPQMPNSGYWQVKLRDGARGTWVYIHRLVCRAFHGEPRSDQETSHIDGNRINNTPDNLRWATPKENAADKIRHGTLLQGSDHPMAKLNEAQAYGIRLLRAAGVPGSIVSRYFGISQSQVSRIGRNIHWQQVEMPR